MVCSYLKRYVIFLLFHFWKYDTHQKATETGQNISQKYGMWFVQGMTKLPGKEQSRGMRYHRNLWNREQHCRNCVCLRKIKGTERNYLVVNSIPNTVPSLGFSHIKWQTRGHPRSQKAAGLHLQRKGHSPLRQQHSSYCWGVAGKLSACADKVFCEYQAICHYKCREEELKAPLDFQYSEKETQLWGLMNTQNIMYLKSNSSLFYSLCLRYLHALTKILRGLSHIQWKWEIVTGERLCFLSDAEHEWACPSSPRHTVLQLHTLPRRSIYSNDTMMLYCL